jgi:multicomponent K+:H+ antiporter subunit E
MWLLLNQPITPGQVVLGVILAATLAWASVVLRPVQPTLSRGYLAIVLLNRALKDIVRSNVNVARIVLGLVRDRDIKSGFVEIPLQIKDPHGLAVLAGIVTATPGTVWAGLDPSTNTLTLHVLDLTSDTEWIDWIKKRYEGLLIGIFE